MIQSGKTDLIVNTLGYVKSFFGSTIVVKLGGSIIHNPTSLSFIFTDLKLLHCAGIKVVLVHGGGKAITQALSKKNIASDFVDGLRVTSKEAMSVIESVLCEEINLALVERLSALGLAAIGLSGADNNMLMCDYHSKLHGCVGEIQSVGAGLINYVLSTYEFPNYMIPVIAPIGVNAEGDRFNINADYAASFLANAIEADKLIYLTDQDGIYDSSGANISEVSQDGLDDLIKNKVVEGGMLTKVKTIIAALQGHLSQVHILNGNTPHVLLNEIFTQAGVGTLCSQKEKVGVSV